MLNKEVCKVCVNRAAMRMVRSGLGLLEDFVWSAQDDVMWECGKKVECRAGGGWTIVDVRIVPEKCPYLVEHLVSVDDVE